MGGSGELLRDEMTFLAEKAANPAKYPPSEKVLQRYPAQRDMIGKFPPTKVVLEMHDGAAHVAPTLAWTRSARAMYRSAAKCVAPSPPPPPFCSFCLARLAG